MAKHTWNKETLRWEDADQPAPEPSPELRAKRVRWSKILLANAEDTTSKRLAEKLISRWGLNALDLG